MIQQGTDAWLAERRNGIGGSDIASLLGQNKWGSPLSVYLDKLGLADPLPTTPAMEVGHELEDYVAKKFAELSGFKIVKPRQGIVSHPEVPYFKASVDRLYYYPRHKKKFVLEIKTTSTDIDPDNIPARWYMQAQWYLGVLGLSKCAVAHMSLLRKVVEWQEYDRDEELITQMQQVAHGFWNNHVLAKVPPKPTDKLEVEYLHPQHTLGKAIEADARIESLLKRYKTLKEEEKSVESELEILRDQIAITMADAELIRIGDEIAATFRTAKAGRRFSTERFASDHPELYQRYMQEVPGGRRLLVK